MSFYPTPHFSLLNQANGCIGYAIILRDASLHACVGSDRSDLIDAQRRHVLALSENIAPLLNRIALVLKRSAGEQMGRITARRIIANVASVLPWRKRAAFILVCGSVGINLLPVYGKSAVTLPGNSADPRPATFGTARLVSPGIKSFGHGCVIGKAESFTLVGSHLASSFAYVVRLGYSVISAARAAPFYSTGGGLCR